MTPNADYEGRYRVTGGPWPERIGLLARIIDPATQPRHYPWVRLGKDDVVVLIENDPFHKFGRNWSCVMSRKHLSSNDAMKGEPNEQAAP